MREMSDREWVNHLKSHIKHLKAGAVFRINELADPVDWKNLPRATRNILGREIRREVDGRRLPGVKVLHTWKTSPNRQLVYEVEDQILIEERPRERSDEEWVDYLEDRARRQEVGSFFKLRDIADPEEWGAISVRRRQRIGRLFMRRAETVLRDILECHRWTIHDRRAGYTRI